MPNPDRRTRLRIRARQNARDKARDADPNSGYDNPNEAKIAHLFRRICRTERKVAKAARRARTPGTQDAAASHLTDRT